MKNTKGGKRGSRRRPTLHRIGQGLGVVIMDLENLLHTARRASPQAVQRRFEHTVSIASKCATQVQFTGCGDVDLVTMLIEPAQRLDVRLYPGKKGPDRADGEIARRLLHDVPPSTEVVVIGSGDHYYAEVASHHRDQGRHVIAMAQRTAMSAELLAEVDDFWPLDA